MTQRYIYRAVEEPQKEAGEDLDWDGLLCQFLESRKKRTEKYRYDLKNSLTRAHRALTEMGICRPHLMTVRAAKSYRNQYQSETGVSDTTVNHMTQKLMTEFTWAFQEELFPVDKLAALKKWKLLTKNDTSLSGSMRSMPSLKLFTTPGPQLMPLPAASAAKTPVNSSPPATSA